MSNLNLDYEMETVYDCKQVTLHVRVSNRAALGLYEKKLSYIRDDVDPKYYADEEDAYKMVKYFGEPPSRKKKKESQEEQKNEDTPSQTQEDEPKSKNKKKKNKKRK